MTAREEESSRDYPNTDAAGVRHLQRECGDGGAKGDRTPDLLHAMQALSQLSYGPGTRAVSALGL